MESSNEVTQYSSQLDKILPPEIDLTEERKFSSEELEKYKKLYHEMLDCVLTHQAEIQAALDLFGEEEAISQLRLSHPKMG